MPAEQKPSLYDVAIDPDSDTSGAKLASYVGWGKRVLDVGCATGALARVLVAQRCVVVGVEIDRGAAKLAEEVCERVVVADLDLVDLAQDLAAGSFDVITLGDVLEHLRDPGALLTQLPALLKPGGYAAISLPNVAHGSVRLALAHGTFPRTDVGLLDRTHLQFWTRPQLVELLETNGWSAIHVEGTTAPIEASEVTYPDDELTRRMLPTLRVDPLSTIYQHVAVAVPTPAEGISGLARLIADLSQRAQRQSEALAVAGDDAADQEREVRALVDARFEQTLRVRDDELRVRILTQRVDAQAAGHARQLGAAQWLRQTQLRKQRKRHRRVTRELQTQLQDAQAALQATQRTLDDIHKSKFWRAASAYRQVVGRARSLGPA